MQNPSKIIACLLFACLFFLSAGLSVHAFGPLYDLGVFAFEENDYVNAESYFKKALETDPQNARVAQFLGKTYIKLERYEEALVYLNSADEKDPELPGLKFDRAYVYFRLEDYGRASALFRTIAEEAPSDASASYHAGIALY